MMNALRKSPETYTPEEYLELERNADERHEFVDGHLYTMAGESLSHSRICVNITREVSSGLLGKRCEALSPNMKVRTSNASLFSYPDLTIVCGEPLFHDRKKDVVINPKAVFEVLSSSTERYDRTIKFQRYRMGNETLTDYILIAQESSSVEHYHRDERNNWIFETYYRLSDTLLLPEIELAILLERIYDRVDVQPPKESASEAD